MGLGKQIRLKRLFAHPSGRLCSVAVDHFLNYTADHLPEGIRDLPTTLAAVVEGKPDAVTMHKGAALSCWPPHAARVPLILQSSLLRPDDSADELTAHPEDAVRLGAEAYAICAYVRGAREAVYLRRVADAVRQAERWDMPVIVHIYPRRFGADGKVDISFEAEDIDWAVHCAMECGVDVIKVPFTGDAQSYAQIIGRVPMPVVAAGGPRAGSLREALDMAAGVVSSGARGMTIGRNIWGFAHVTKAVLAFRAVLHDGVGPAEALRGALP